MRKISAEIVTDSSAFGKELAMLAYLRAGWPDAREDVPRAVAEIPFGESCRMTDTERN